MSRDKKSEDFWTVQEFFPVDLSQYQLLDNHITQTVTGSCMLYCYQY
jgi:hypothetical protein